MPLRTEGDLLAEDARKKAYQELAKQYMDRLRDDPAWFGLSVMGHECPDPTVMDPPIGYVPGPDLLTMIRTMVQQHTQQEEFESIEDADDFDMEDEMEPVSPWEERFYQTMAPDDPLAPGVGVGTGEEPQSEIDAKPKQASVATPPKPKAKAAKPLSGQASPPLDDEE